MTKYTLKFLYLEPLEDIIYLINVEKLSTKWLELDLFNIQFNIICSSQYL